MGKRYVYWIKTDLYDGGNNYIPFDKIESIIRDNIWSEEQDEAYQFGKSLE